MSVALPADAIPIGTYAGLDQYLDAFAEGVLQLILLLGRPGTGKTQRVKDAIRRSGSLGKATNPSAANEQIERILYIDGYLSPFGLYRQLWLHRDGRVVIDDLDKLYAQSECLHILKQLCNNSPIRQLSWYNRMTNLSVDTPASFETTSTVMLIANEWRTLNADVRALEDRALVMHFDPPNHEVHAEVGKWFHDEEVYEFIGSFLLACRACRFVTI